MLRFEIELQGSESPEAELESKIFRAPTLMSVGARYRLIAGQKVQKQMKQKSIGRFNPREKKATASWRFKPLCSKSFPKLKSQKSQRKWYKFAPD
ncbi:MAG: hypothetical protein EAZ60_25550 [Oscillatoriales cyanobacterium]|nr:MAG: hypothetical protein EAZ83_14735 [Oscillatoriales cyanobacterium]TAE95543.1 MAG: hypothetical protein EAZ79_18710 [Oscillatoriales cyanobacterium]TAF19089.1 MAG: hypothetical protein EAZ73_16530 [Oscillatoriales cyanobacterium]TAF31658.1 MAG: hypothetical protein EAZ69_19070 [Oscillatoriales cyanobacterium]TAF51704.1 MAG: hypothetical protein EAZ60_25550 [Oscillatoriales cyanobacterium]